ncbi:MAG: HD-GYP domain-containing protein [Firmicutes bacterium]|nr:HD-GYP domain-containing protein [Bacillota bacterium]
MRLISLDSVVPDMELGKTIYSADGQILVASGVKLKKNYVKRLKELGISCVYIHDGRFDDLEVDDVVSEQTRLSVLKATRDAMLGTKIGKTFDSFKIKIVVEGMVDDLLSSRDILVNLTDIRAMNDYHFAHCTNVAILSIITGLSLGIPRPQLRDLGVGALLHDIGKSRVSEEILNKPGMLAEDEVEEIQAHTTFGFDVLRKQQEISSLSAIIALEHHEKFNGHGYPKGLKDHEIHVYARIVAIADVYDALTTDRIYRPRYLPHEGIEFIMAGSGSHFDPEIVRAFVENIAIYPVGTEVILSSGERAVVSRPNKHFPTRPVVRITHDRDGHELAVFQEIDLLDQLTTFITEVAPNP